MSVSKFVILGGLRTEIRNSRHINNFTEMADVIDEQFFKLCWGLSAAMLSSGLILF